MLYYLSNVIKKRQSSGTRFTLAVPQLEIRAGDRIAIVGRSGTGKSTLLDLLAMTLSPTSAGKFLFQPSITATVDVARQWARSGGGGLGLVRRQHMGYVLQTGGLLPFMSVRDNICLPRKLVNLPGTDYVDEIVSRLGLDRLMRMFPANLSVGERQRVAVARALSHRPAVILADEPTASVDPVNAAEIMNLFSELTRESGATVVIASHDFSGSEEWMMRRLEPEVEETVDGVRSSFVMQS